MFRPRIIPVLLLKNKGLIKTEKFNKKKAKYVGDPINAVRIFNDLEADELIFLDVEATTKGKLIDIDLVKKISDEAYMPFGVGGGIKKLSDVDLILNNGAEKVIINSEATRNLNLIAQIANKYGSQSVAICLDIKKNIFGRQKITINGGAKSTNLNLETYIRDVIQSGAGEIIIQSVDNDGMMTGYDLELIKRVSNLSEVPVICLGGAGKVADMIKAYQYSSASALAAGSMFVFHGRRKAVLINHPDKNQIKQSLKHE